MSQLQIHPQGPSIKRRRGTPHDKTGCLTCRHRRKKCLQNTFPVCGSCTRLNLECVREPPRRLSAERSKTGKDVTDSSFLKPLDLVTGLNPDSLLYSTFSESKLTTRRHFMRYYVEFLARMLSTNERHNSFLSAFLPMAIESPVLQDAIVALAAGNLSTFDQSYTVAALEARSTALSKLMKSISSPSDEISNHEINLASCLILSTSDATLGHRTGWYEHLVGAKDIIMSAQTHLSNGKRVCGPDAFKNGLEGEWLLRNFAYHDILNSITSGSKPLIEGDYLDGITNVVDSYLGVASQILVFVSQISSLDPLSSMGNVQSNDFWSQCEAIELDLRRWTCSPDTEADLAAMAYAYRSAALIYLYRRMRKSILLRPYLDVDVLIRTEVATTLRHISDIPLKASPECSLLFPLFMAGGEAIDSIDIDVIRVRLKLIGERRGFQNVNRACEVLEELWIQRNTSTDFENQDLDWEFVLEKQGGGLLLC